MRLLSILCLIFFFGCGGGEKKVDYTVAFDPTWTTLALPGRELQLREFSREILQAIEKVEGVRIGIKETNWDNLIPGLQKGNYQGILNNLPSYLFYEKIYDFSDLYLSTGPTVVMSVSSSPHSLNDLAGKEIAIIEGSDYGLLLEKYPDVIQRSYLTVPAALNAVSTGEIDGVMLDVITAGAYCNDLFQGKLKIAFPPLNGDGLRLVTIHGKNEGLIRRFNKGLKALKEDGSYQKIAEKWKLSST